MTPPAATAAARTADPRTLRRTGPSAPRRVSGPPRRVSGPSRGRAGAPGRQAAARTRINAAPGLRPSHARVHTAGAGSLAVGVGAGVLALPGRGIRSAVRSLPEAGSLSDRLLRSRAWIGVVAGLLIGLVFLQVSLLKVNAGIGASVQQTSVLEAQNNVLRGQINQLSEDGRITQEAEQQLGMLMPAADSVRYLRSSAPGGVGGAGGAVLADTTAADGSGDTASADATAVDDGSGDATATDTTSAADGSGDTTDTTDTTDTSATAGDTSYDTASTDTASTDSGAADETAVADSGAAPEAGGAVASPAG